MVDAKEMAASSIRALIFEPPLVYPPHEPHNSPPNASLPPSRQCADSCRCFVARISGVSCFLRFVFLRFVFLRFLGLLLVGYSIITATALKVPDCRQVGDSSVMQFRPNADCDSTCHAPPLLQAPAAQHNTHTKHTKHTKDTKHTH